MNYFFQLIINIILVKYQQKHMYLCYIYTINITITITISRLILN